MICWGVKTHRLTTSGTGAYKLQSWTYCRQSTVVLSLKVLLSIKHNAMQALWFPVWDSAWRARTQDATRRSHPSLKLIVLWSQPRNGATRAGEMVAFGGFGFVHYVIKPDTAGTQRVSLKSTIPLLTENDQEKSYVQMLGFNRLVFVFMCHSFYRR